MVLLSAPLSENSAPIIHYPASVAATAAAAVVFAAVQLLCLRSGRSKWLRLTPLWIALCSTLVSLTCVVSLYAPYEMGFVLFCSLAALLGCLAGLGAAWMRTRK